MDKLAIRHTYRKLDASLQVLSAAPDAALPVFPPSNIDSGPRTLDRVSSHCSLVPALVGRSALLAPLGVRIHLDALVEFIA